ncbi:MAG: hypothetical protein J7497_16385, partial [Chitinophagaceae bacterium]|nr:hypothetical protein [Chitinophagaceae bacterium]
MRYKYQYRNLLQYGAVAEKDPGEKSFIDFYSVHLFARNIGKIKSFAVGDYTLNIGQGLIHWQSQAFRKTSSVISIKRQADIIRPYNSAGEYNFQRGVAITFKKNKWEPTVFFSYRKLSANISNDSIYKDVITSINTSGLHVTESEIKNKNNTSVVNYGGSLKYISGQGSVAVNILSYNYSLPLLKRDDPYNLYALKGNNLTNGSIDYNYTHNNIHLFGELAMSVNGARAMINGIMTSLHSSIDIAVLYRKADKDYQSVYGNAFTESTMPSNEEGIYIGFSIRPYQRWKIDVYSDFFRFPWLKYRVDAPTIGNQYLVQLTWKPDKKIEVYTRLRYRHKPLNASGGRTNYPEDQVQQNWRTHISFQVSRSLLLRNRVEVCRYVKGFIALPENGYLFYTDLVYKPLGKPFSGNFRFQVFECDSYATRIYAYENDVMYASSTPSFFNKGTRIYCNGRVKLNARIMPKLNAD